MLFRDSFLTNAGVAILARATGQEGAVVWTRAATTDLDTNSKTASQMDRLTEDDLGTKTSSGVVTNVVVDDARQSVAIHCELTNAEYYGMARTLGVWAKIQGDAQDVLVVVARCGEGVTPTYINPASEGVVKAFVDFSLEITDEQAQAVAVAVGYYATSSALQDEVAARESLAKRVVTTHSAADASAGQGQNILGWKSFHSLPMMIGDLDATVNWIFADYIPMIMAEKGKCIYRVYNDNYNNINSIYVSGHFYYNDTTKINHGVSAEDNAQTGEVTVTDYLKKNGTQTCWLKKETDTDGRGSVGMYIRDRNMNYPYGIKLYENTTSYYADIYSYMVNIKAGRDVKIISQSNEIELSAVNINLKGVTAIDGAFNVVAYTASTHEYRGDLTISGHNGTGGNVKPATDGTQTLGTASYEWSDVYTKNLHVATVILTDNGNVNIGGDSAKSIKIQYTSENKVCVFPYTNTGFYLGDNTHVWERVYTSRLIGANGQAVIATVTDAENATNALNALNATNATNAYCDTRINGDHDNIASKYLILAKEKLTGTNDIEKFKSITFEDGNEEDKQSFDMTNIVRHIISGRKDSGTNGYANTLTNDIGKLGLFVYSGSYKIKSSGIFLDGRNLSEVSLCLGDDYRTFGLWTTHINQGSAVVQSGKWLSLTYMSNQIPSGTTVNNVNQLVLAIKVSNELYTET